MSDLGSLSECLVDNDPAARVRARRLRSKALALSIALEAAILAALLLWPLIAPGVLTAHYIVTPAPPYSGGSAPAPRANGGASSTHVAFSADLPGRLRAGGSSVAPGKSFGGAVDRPGPRRMEAKARACQAQRQELARRNRRSRDRPGAAARRAASCAADATEARE